MQQKHVKTSVISLLLACSMLVFAQAAEISSLIPIGHTVGIQMSAEGVLVVRMMCRQNPVKSALRGMQVCRKAT